MKDYVSHFSAAYIHNIPQLNHIIGEEYIRKYLNDKAIDITISDPNKTYYKQGRRPHLSTVPLPRNSVNLHERQLVASPELVFLQLATKLSFHRLILLGLQMCQHKVGKPWEAVTTKKKLMAFIEKTALHKGHAPAVQALRYIEDSSASIMESIVFMILTLPHTLGGYGLTGACFNYKIKLDKKYRQNHYSVDIYYKEKNVAVEYNSFAFHKNPAEQGRDQLKSSTLERHGVEVIGLKTIQLYDKDACEEFILNLSSRLGKRMRIRAKGFDEAHRVIRSLLPSKEKAQELSEK